MIQFSAISAACQLDTIEKVSTRRYSVGMKENNFPSDKLDKFMLRFPDGMRERIKKMADDSGRSMNAEIVHRLEASFVLESVGDDVLSAEQAKAVAIAAQANLLENSKRECLARIKSSALKGISRADFNWRNFAGISETEEFDEEFDPEIFSNYVNPLTEYLKKLGYSVVREGEDLFIDF